MNRQNSIKTDIAFMRKSLRQAKKGLGRTSPYPTVGAVIVRNGNVIATGYHRKAGLPHAEVEALNKLGGKAPGDTLYVTLEPCNHYGRTPPCTEAILKSGLGVGIEHFWRLQNYDCISGHKRTGAATDRRLSG